MHACIRYEGIVVLSYIIVRRIHGLFGVIFSISNEKAEFFLLLLFLLMIFLSMKTCCTVPLSKRSHCSPWEN